MSSSAKMWQGVSVSAVQSGPSRASQSSRVKGGGREGSSAGRNLAWKARCQVGVWRGFSKREKKWKTRV